MPHQGLANEDGVGSGVESALGVGGAFESGFRDEENFIRDFVGQLFGGEEVGGEGFEVAVVDANEIGPEFESPLHFGEVVDFDEDVELHVAGGIIEAAELIVIQRGDDEEDGIGSGYAGFVDLAFVDGEVFAQERDGGDFRDLDEVGKVPLKVFFVGQDGHAGGAAVDISLGLTDVIEVGIDDAGGGRGFFDFGNDAELVGSSVEGRSESSELIAHQGGSPQFPGEGNEGLNLLFLKGDNFIQLVHRRRSSNTA